MAFRDYRRSFALIISFFFVMVWVIFWLFIDFAKDVGKVDMECSYADAIVAITGGRGRMEAGLKMLLAGKGKYLILSGVDKESNVESIFFMRIWEKKVMPDRVILEKDSRSTYENALATRKIIDSYDFKSIILLTSEYHMKRALYTFKRILPQDVMICPYPLNTPNFKVDTWWKDRKSLSMLLTEFIKFYWYRIWL